MKSIDWLGKRIQAFQQNWVDYLQEEIRYLPPRAEVEQFFKEVTQLSREVEKLEQKIKSL